LKVNFRAIFVANVYYLLYLCSENENNHTMSTLEFNALRGELAREMLNIESIEVLQKVQRALRRAIKQEQKEEYIEKEEILASVREGLLEVKHAHETGVKLMTAEELLNEL
jgi:hypothetical protein